MNCRTESFFTDHSVYWCLKVNAGSLATSKLISYLCNMQWRGCSLIIRTIWILYLRNDPTVELAILWLQFVYLLWNPYVNVHKVWINLKIYFILQIFCSHFCVCKNIFSFFFASLQVYTYIFWNIYIYIYIYNVYNIYVYIYVFV